MSYCPTILLSFCHGVLLSYCPIVLLSYCPIVLLFYCPTVLLSYCPTVLLFYCPTVLLSYCPTVPVSQHQEVLLGVSHIPGLYIQSMLLYTGDMAQSQMITLGNIGLCNIHHLFLFQCRLHWNWCAKELADPPLFTRIAVVLFLCSTFSTFSTFSCRLHCTTERNCCQAQESPESSSGGWPGSKSFEALFA